MAARKDEGVDGLVLGAALEEEAHGHIVVVLNVHGVIEAFGPYGEMEAHEIATFAEHLVPTWVFDLDGNQRYGCEGDSPDQPKNHRAHPTRSGPT